MRLSQINPFNSLFGRVFVWFWSALLIILVSAFFLTKQLTNVVEVNALSQQQATEAEAVMQRLSTSTQRGADIKQVLRRLGQRNGRQLVAINENTSQINFGFPAPLLGNAEELRGFVQSDSPLLIRLNNMEFVGPYRLSQKQTQYSVFVGRLLLRSERGGITRSRAAIAGLVLMIFLSTLFCFGLVLSITKPLGALRSASNKLAKGDLSARIEGLGTRKDEVGNLAKDFNSMAARLQSLVDSQKQLMANVSHELRTPLTRLQLAVALLEEDLRVERQGGENKHLVRIENEITKMDEMIGQVLTIAKINTSAQRVNLQKISLATLLDNLLKDAKFEAEALHKKITVGAIPEIYINGDPQLLVSAIENIIRNAIRFAKSEVYCEFVLEQVAQSAEQSTLISMLISDDGEGMQVQEIDKVYDPFFRGKHQVHGRNKGAGLGLAIAKAAIELHGGTICAVTGGSQIASGISAPKAHTHESSRLCGLSVIIRLPIVD